MKWARLQLVGLLVGVSPQASEQFGDISVGASAIYTGNTYHGYAEMRVMLENHSHEKSHVVTLIYPNNTYGNYGNNIDRVSRSVTLGPDARELVSLLQPPLPAQGDGSIRVEVDRRHEGEVHAPNANNHCSAIWRGGNRSASIFVSRSLDFDSVERVFRATQGAYSPAMATGPPDAGTRGYGMGSWQNCWMPDASRSGDPAWLELDYARPLPVNKITIYRAPGAGISGTISLIGNSGTNLLTMPIPSAPYVHSGMGPATPHVLPRGTLVATCPVTPEPVKTVRLDFGPPSGRNIAIDAVEISGPSGSAWASDARASSDNSASTATYAGSNPDAVESLRAELPASEWSENWLAYSPFDCVVLDAGDITSMPAAVQRALIDYLSAGGFVVVAGLNDLPDTWPTARKEITGPGLKYNIGFGNCFVFPAASFASLDPDTVRAMHQEVRERARYWQTLPADANSANGAVPVVASLKIPTRGIVIIMLAFVIAIGPVNIICLNRWKRRTWMLWTIPAISLVTTALVFVYSLLREGITPDARIVGLTVINQAAHHAATLGGTAFYCPLTPSSGLHFDFGTEATPLVEQGYGSGNSREVDWTQAQEFQRGWVSSRVPAYFHVRKSETRRERIQVLNEGGKLAIVNGLGAPIQSLWLASSDRTVYRAGTIAAGEKAALAVAPQQLVTDSSGLDGIQRQIGYAGRGDSLSNDAPKFLLPDTYIAVLNGNPFIENALGPAASAKRTKSSSIVFGFLDTPVVK